MFYNIRERDFSGQLAMEGLLMFKCVLQARADFLTLCPKPCCSYNKIIQASVVRWKITLK